MYAYTHLDHHSHAVVTGRVRHLRRRVSAVHAAQPRRVQVGGTDGSKPAGRRGVGGKEERECVCCVCVYVCVVLCRL